MKYEEIKMQFPKSCKAIGEFAKKWALVFQKHIADAEGGDETPEEIPEAVLEQVTAFLMQGNPRTLYDFFDENKIFLSPIYRASGFIYDVITEDLKKGVVSGGDYPNRPQAEDAMFIQAFKILEAKL